MFHLNKHGDITIFIVPSGIIISHQIIFNLDNVQNIKPFYNQ